MFYLAFRHSSSYEVVKTVVDACVKKPIVAMVNDSKFNEAGYFPYTLSIADPEDVFDFYSGNIVLSIALDPEVVARTSAALNRRVELDIDSYYPLTVYRRDGNGVEHPVVAVGRHIFTRIFTEFISPKWFIEETVARADAAEEQFSPDAPFRIS